MKTEVGIGVAVLAALAAQGKDFDRATLNAMLEKLAASPEPRIKNGPMAMCYRMAMPQPVEVRHVCPTCGAVTRFVSTFLTNDLAFLRDGAVALTGMGLDIALDETPLCRACTPGPKAPVAGRLKRDVSDWKAGEKVRILTIYRGRYCTITSPGRRVAWMEASEVTNGVVSVDWAYARARSRHENGPTPVVRELRRGNPVTVLSREPGDHADEIRVDASNWGRQLGGVAIEDFEDLEYGDAALEDRLEKVTWVINGRHIPARKTDVELLKAFLTGKQVLKGSRGEEVPLKRRIDRLRELLGEPAK